MGDGIGKTMSVGHSFSVFSTIQEKNSQAFSGTLLRGYAISVITAHALGQHMWSASPGLQARLKVLQNSGSQVFMLRVKTLSAQDCHS